MEVIIYHETYDTDESLDNFLDLLYNSRMTFLASDLLKEGLSALDISNAVERAIVIAKTSGVKIRQHFAFVYTQNESELIKDCKLSRLGYALVLMNARPDISIVSHWQLKLLNNFFK